MAPVGAATSLPRSTWVMARRPEWGPEEQLGELDPLRLGLAGGDARDLEDPRVGEVSDEAIADQGQVIEGPGDPEGVVGAGPLPAEEVLRVRPHRGEPERVEEPALVEGAEGLYELEAKLVRDPVRA